MMFKAEPSGTILHFGVSSRRRNRVEARSATKAAPIAPDPTEQELGRILAALFAAELDGRPAYIVNSGMLDDDGALLGDNLGATGADFDLLCQGAIGDRWRGRGLALAINTERIVSAYRDTNDFDQLRAAMFATFLHEAAHVAQLELALPKSEPSEELIAELADGDLEAAESVSGVVAENVGFAIDEQHDAQFFHALLHVAARCETEFGISCEYALNEFAAYGLSDAALYAATMKHENQRQPLTALAKSVPVTFQALFDSDCKRIAEGRGPLFPVNQ